jgi:hypothetical protein
MLLGWGLSVAFRGSQAHSMQECFRRTAGFPPQAEYERNMRPFPIAGLLLLALGAAPPAQNRHAQLTADQTRQLAELAARYDHIDLSDTHIEFNSMDLGASFIHGFSSFILIRESVTPGPDETLRRYAVNRRTGDVWEMTMCRHYSFPELDHAQRTMTGRAVGADAGGLAAQQKALGCATQHADPAS